MRSRLYTILSLCCLCAWLAGCAGGSHGGSDETDASAVVLEEPHPVEPEPVAVPVHAPVPHPPAAVEHLPAIPTQAEPLLPLTPDTLAGQWQLNLDASGFVIHRRTTRAVVEGVLHITRYPSLLTATFTDMDDRAFSWTHQGVVDVTGEDTATFGVEPWLDFSVHVTAHQLTLVDWVGSLRVYDRIDS